MLRTLLLVAMLGGCDRQPEAPPENPAPSVPVPRAAATAEQVVPAAVEAEPAPRPLPEMLVADRDSIEFGLARLANCQDYEAYVHRALTRYHLAKAFPDRVGSAIEAEFRTPLESRARSVVVDGDWLYREKGAELYVVNLPSGSAHAVTNEMYTAPAIQAASHGWMFFGTSRSMSGAKFETFWPGPSTGGWTVDRSGRKAMSYESFRTASAEAYAIENGQLRYQRLMRFGGELAQIEPRERFAYVLVFTEPHIAPDVAREARLLAEKPADFDALAQSLGELQVASPEAARPGYSYQFNPKGGQTPNGQGHAKCGDIWVPRDDASAGHRLLAVHRFDYSQKKMTGSWAVGVDEHVVATIAGDTLFMARRVRGARKGEALEQPLSEVDVFDLSNDFALLHATPVDGAPGELVCAPNGCMLTTTRWAESETLVHVITADGVSEPTAARPKQRLAAVIGRPTWDIWSAELPTTYDVVFVVGEHTVAARLADKRVELEVFRADGTSVAKTESPANGRVLRWEPDEVVSSPNRFLLPLSVLTDDGDDFTALGGTLDGDQLAVRWVDAGRDLVAVTAQGAVSLSAAGVTWQAPGTTQVVTWDAVEVTHGGRPTAAK